MRTTKYRVVAALCVVLTAVPLSAHHAFSAEFDEQKPIKLAGTVAGMDWLNPHCWLHLEVPQPDGTVVQWMVEGGAPNALLRRGHCLRELGNFADATQSFTTAGELAHLNGDMIGTLRARIGEAKIVVARGSPTIRSPIRSQ